MQYTFGEHLHRFAVWTAARASQRGFTTTQNIEKAINVTGLQEFVENPPENLDDTSFDTFHRETSKKLVKELKRALNGSKDKEKATYGRAAKIISIYIKSAYILPNKGKGVISKIAHPPVDRILLHNIHKDQKEFGFKKVNWTDLDEKGYFDVIKKLRSMDYNSFWEVEKYWEPR